MAPTAAGHDTHVTYLWEDGGFAQSPSDSTAKTFGSDATLQNFEGSNNAVRAFAPGSRQAPEIIEHTFEGSFSLQFTLTNPWWLGAVLTQPTSSTGVHTYDGGDPSSMRIQFGNTQTSTQRELLGCVATSCSISASTGDMVTVSIDGAYADESTNGTVDSQVATTYRPMHFGHATVSRGGDTLGLVQEATLNIENNIDLINELGTRFAVDYSPKVREVTLDVQDIVDSEDEAERMYGQASEPAEAVTNTADLVFEFDDGGAGGSTNTLTININGAIGDSYSLSGAGNPEEDLTGEIAEMAPTVDAEAENDDDTAP